MLMILIIGLLIFLSCVLFIYKYFKNSPNELCRKKIDSKEEDTEHYKNLKQAIADLYGIFPDTNKPKRFDRTDCIDGGVNDDDIIEFTEVRRNKLSVWFIERMEFYSAWPTEQEVRYFLPRVLELAICDIENFYPWSSYGTILYYQLNHNDESIDLSLQERSCIENYIKHLFIYFAHQNEDIDPLILLVSSIEKSVDMYLEYWSKVPKVLQEKQFKHYLKSFWNIEKGKVIYKWSDYKDYEYNNMHHVLMWILQDKHVKEFDFFTQEPWIDFLTIRT